MFGNLKIGCKVLFIIAQNIENGRGARVTAVPTLMYSIVYSLLMDVQEIMSTEGEVSCTIWSDKTMV